MADGSKSEGGLKQAKPLAWSIPEDMGSKVDFAEQVSFAVTRSLTEHVQTALRDATASTLQRLSVATLRMSRVLDRLELNMEKPEKVAVTAPASKPRKQKAASVAISFEAADRTFPVNLCQLPGASGKLHKQGSRGTLELEGWAPLKEGPGGDAISTAAKSRRAVSVQGWDEDFTGVVSSHGLSQEPPLGLRRLTDGGNSAGVLPQEYRKQKKGEKMGMKGLEDRLAKELFRAGAGASFMHRDDKDPSFDNDLSISRTSSRKTPSEKLESPRKVAERIPSCEAKNDKHGLPSDPRSLPERFLQKAVAPSKPPPMLPDTDVSLMPGALMQKEAVGAPAGIARVLEVSPHAEGRGSIGEEEEEEVANSKASLANSEMIPNLEQKRVANPTNTSITNRSKKGSVQLRDEKNDELIRATIKSSPKTTKQEHSTHESYHLSETQDTLSTEEKETQKVSRCFSCLQSAGNVLVKAILRVNCAESICQNRLGTIAFQAVLVGLALLAVGWNMTSVLNAYISETFGRYLVYDFGLSMGAFLCLLCCGCLRRWTNVAECESMLDAFADARGLHEDWLSHCRGDAALVLTVWVLAVCERARELFMTNDLMAFGYILEGDGTMHCLGSFAVSSGLLMACLFRVMRVCRGFYVVIDDFSYNLVTTSNLGVAEQEWNLMQALLRRSCHSLQYLFIVLQSTIVAAMMLGVDDFYRLNAGGSHLISGGIVLAGLAQMFLSAASVTDHCARLPSFVNSLGFGRELDADRMYLVEYMFYSQAGFYLFEVRITRDMVLKAFYVTGMAVFYFATKVVAGV